MRLASVDASLQSPQHRLWCHGLLIASLFMASALVAYARALVPYNSDMAMVGLMARDILHNGDRPVFFDGSEYAGTLEQYWVAAWFALFPENTTTHRVAIAVLLLLTVLILWRYSLKFLPPLPSLFGGLYLATAPIFFFRRGLTSEGPYTPIYLIAAVCLLLMYDLAINPASGSSAKKRGFVLGLFLGLGWWTHPLAVCLAPPTLIALSWKRAPRGFFGLLAPSVAGFFVGSCPWWLRNLHTGWASVAGGDAAGASLKNALEQIRVLWTTGVPVLMGGLSSSNDAQSFSGAFWMSWALLVTLVFYGCSQIFRSTESSSSLGFLLVLTFAVSCPLAALLSRRTNFVEPRLIFPAYFALAPLLGSFAARSRLPLAVRSSVASMAIVLSVGSHVAAQPVRPLPSRTVAALRDLKHDAVYASYWDAYLISFLSDGHIVGSPFGRNEVVRRNRDRALVDSASSPAFVLREEPAQRLRAFFRHRNIRFVTTRVDDLWIFTDITPTGIEALRACGCVPSGLGPSELYFRSFTGPPKVAPDSLATYRVAIDNNGRLPWTPELSIDYTWSDEGGTPTSILGGKTPSRLPLLSPGQHAELQIPIRTPHSAGLRYLSFHINEDGVGRLQAGGVTSRAQVVTP